MPSNDAYDRADVALCCSSVMNPIKSTGEPSDAYLGLLYPTEEFKIYG